MFPRIPAAVFAATLTCFISCGSLMAQAPSTTFRTSLIESYAASYSYSGKSGYKHGATPGETSVNHIEGSFSGRIALSETLSFEHGAAFGLNFIDSDASVPVPERLGELSVNVGLTKKFSDQWSGSIYARPGYYGDLEHYTMRTLNVPLLLLGNYVQNSYTMWFFGVSVNPFSEYVVMPAIGLRYALSHDWTLNAGFPRFGVSWRVTKPLELSLGASIQGGGYRVTEAPGGAEAAAITNTSRLANTYLNYREIRVGVGVDYKIAEKVSVSVEGGWMADRRFDYYDHDYELKGKSAAYLTLALNARY